MTDLSDRFAQLMARMAKSDADLFRTIGEQNASVRQLVEELAPHGAADATVAGAAALAVAPAETLPPAGLLPPEACELKALKARFGKLAEAQSWLEAQIGKAPKQPTWAVIAQTCRSGAWPAAAAKRQASPRTALTATDLDGRLLQLEQRLDQRLQRLEQLLLQIASSVLTDRPS